MTETPRTPLTAAEVTAAVADPWRVIGDALQAAYATSNMVTGGRFVARIIDAAEAANHHPDIDLHYGSVHLTLSTHSSHRITAADVALAGAIADIAAEMDLSPLAAPPARFDLAIDALDLEAIRPFWRAVLGYRDDPEHTLADLTDPDGLLPPVWFQQMDSPRSQRSRMHVDLWLPHDVVADRMAAALDAGGRLVTDEHAPEFWVLADAEGNEICLCTWQEREGAQTE
ncbi:MULTISPECIES: VOC family protein [Gordonia]|jgi:4a-hydroxytetrahydrobiopterin dehydratase|uniref:Putative pterin-4-alpha-carbinolamine dehydratase n=1 Tax=Gordonia desulfuricans TaxID=89051 RepID=A0A7K3LKS8_9ACTN|nr:VOC family protein [Gordonia desulfuricans]NDK88834.1 pterin-4-alpha-carbinolamine dehydratase [Gordonia desulfuricans]